MKWHLNVLLFPIALKTAIPSDCFRDDLKSKLLTDEFEY